MSFKKAKRNNIITFETHLLHVLLENSERIHAYFFTHKPKKNLTKNLHNIHIQISYITLKICLSMKMFDVKYFYIKRL